MNLRLLDDKTLAASFDETHLEASKEQHYIKRQGNHGRQICSFTAKVGARTSESQRFFALAFQRRPSVFVIPTHFDTTFGFNIFY